MEVPKISKKEVNRISNIFKNLKKQDGSRLLTNEESDNLANLRFESGELLFDEESFIYQVSWMLHKIGYDTTYKFLVDNLSNRKQMLFESPLMTKEREKFQVDMEIYRNKPDPVMGGEICPKCRSDQTISIEKQTRSADEPVTIKVTCIQCKYHWTAQ